MNRKTIRWARLAVASCVAAVAIGCDNNESAYLDQQANAVAVRLAGGDGAAVAEQITTAAQGSLPVNIQSNQLLGQARLSDARTLASSLLISQSDADAIVTRVSSLASLASVTATIGDTYRQMEPKAPLAMITDLGAKARGDGNVAKFSDLPNGSIPTLAAVKQEKSRLEGELAKAQGELQTATGQRDGLLTKVGGLASQADQQRGEEKLATVKQAADLRQQAAIVSRTISQLQATIDRVTADLGVESMLETQLDAAVKSFEAQRTALDTGWQQTSSKVADQAKLAQSILVADAADGNAGDVSVKVLIAQLNDQLKTVEEKREQTLTAFEDAVTKFNAAKTASDEFGASVSNARTGNADPAEKAAWEALLGTLHADRFNLQKAVAKREEAAVHGSHAQFLLHMASVAASLETVSEGLNTPVPDPFNSQKLKAQAAEAVNKADELLKESQDLLEGITASAENLSAIRPLKASTKIFVNYDRAMLSQFATAAGLAVDVAKEQVYTDSIAAAKQAIVDSREQSIVVPAVPSEIYVEAPKVVEEKPADTAAAATADSPVVAEVRASIKELVSELAATPDDPTVIEKLFSRIKADDSSQALVTAAREFTDINVRLQKAVKDKFGEEGVAAMKEMGAAAQPGGEQMNLETVLKKIDGLPITSSDETHAAIAIPGGGEGADAPAAKLIKEEELWKLDLTELPPGLKLASAGIIGMLEPMKQKMNQLVADVEAGKYTTVDEVKAAIKAMMPAAPQTPAPTDTPAAAETPAPAETPVEPPSGNGGRAGGLPNDIPEAPPEPPAPTPAPQP